MICRATWEWIVGVSPHTGQPKTVIWRMARDGETGYRTDPTTGIPVCLGHVLLRPEEEDMLTVPLPMGVDLDMVRYRGRAIYTVGRTQAIQTKNPRYGGQTVARRRVLRIRLLAPRMADRSDIEQSGYQTVEQLLEMYGSLYPDHQDDLAWAITISEKNDDEAH